MWQKWKVGECEVRLGKEVGWLVSYWAAWFWQPKIKRSRHPHSCLDLCNNSECFIVHLCPYLSLSPGKKVDEGKDCISWYFPSTSQFPSRFTVSAQWIDGCQFLSFSSLSPMKSITLPDLRFKRREETVLCFFTESWDSVEIKATAAGKFLTKGPGFERGGTPQHITWLWPPYCPHAPITLTHRQLRPEKLKNRFLSLQS